ncbi:MAG: transcriptional regulator GcvA [Pseudomonadota bacterium]
MTKNHERSPSLRAMKAFEAAARLGGFSAAASELFITQGAVSRLVQSLENDIGLPLFDRRGRWIELTDAGRHYADSLSDAFRSIERATHEVRRRKEAASFTVSMLPSFAVHWFVPRLPDLLARHRDMDLRVAASRDLASFSDDADAAVRFGAGDWADVQATFLVRELIFPVCHPALLAPDGPIACAEDLAAANLLHGNAPISWKDWFDAAGIDGPKIFSGPHFDDGAAMMQAALNGAGVALGRSTLVRDALAENRLAAPFGPALQAPRGFGCYLVRPDWRPRHPYFDRFRGWISDAMDRALEGHPKPVRRLSS